MTTPNNPNPLTALSRVVMGRPPTGTQAFELVSGTVVSATNSEAVVTLDNFGNDQATWTCRFESRWGSHNTAQIPPSGTPCLIAFPSNDPVHSGWVIAFAGWPT